MAVIYARRVLAGLMTLDEVPLTWREQVRQLVEEASA